MADPVDDATLAVLRVLEGNEQETGEIAGVEIVGFLEFDRWQELPTLPLLWQLPGREPLPLGELLKRTQQRLLAREPVEAAQ